MHETISINEQGETKKEKDSWEENIKELDFESLEKLSQEVRKLSETSFKKVRNGFENINGKGIYIGERQGKWKITTLSEELKSFQKAFASPSNDYNHLDGMFDAKEELMKEIRNMIEGLGNRIIESSTDQKTDS